MTYLSERQAWETIAEAYATEPKYRTAFQKQLTQSGCCTAVIYAMPIGGFEMMRSMTKKIHQCLLPRRSWFCRPYRRYDHLRADFCNLMAFSCEEG